MKLLHGFEDPPAYRGGFVSIGNFDGVHRGHQGMIAALVRQARSADVPAVVLTFDPHPITLLRPGETPPSLSALPRKFELLTKCGVNCVIAYPTDHALLNLGPEEFFAQIVRGELDARGLVEGPNFYFGRRRAGDVAMLRSLCEAAGLTLEVVPPLKIGRRLVSSSEVRSLIARGNLSEAVSLLGHPYQVRGRVTRGDERGGKIGFPTANLQDVETLLPPDGVYAGIARPGDEEYPAAINLGPNPTFGEERRKFEVHLLDFTGDLYGRTLAVEFLERIRDTRPFAGTDELRTQVNQDIEQVRHTADTKRKE